MKIFGALLVIFGLVDIIGSFVGFDVWYEIGINLPELLWQFSGYIEVTLGYFLWNLGNGDGDDDVSADETVDN